MLIFCEILEWFSLCSLSRQCLWVKSLSCAHSLYSKQGWCLKAAGSVAQYRPYGATGLSPGCTAEVEGTLLLGFDKSNGIVALWYFTVYCNYRSPHHVVTFVLWHDMPKMKCTILYTRRINNIVVNLEKM